MKRQIIHIDENKCNGCGLCVPDCPEGAIQMINGKARLISDLYCDGLGACIGTCPEGAITTEEREAAPYNEALVMENIVRQGTDVIKAHLKHLRDHNEMGFLNEALKILKEKGIEIQESAQQIQTHPQGCPGSANMVFKKNEEIPAKHKGSFSRLAQWPVKLKLLSPYSPVFTDKKVDLLISADCAPYACGNFHDEFLSGRVMATFCPKLDPYIDEYKEKLQIIFSEQDINSVTIARMEVPCCNGVTSIVKEAILKSGKNIKIEETIVKIS
jgi:NAD-dependent dihydropyrimidine dehydrogenase PreA subunit